MSFFNSSRLNSKLAKLNERNAERDQTVANSLLQEGDGELVQIGTDGNGQPIYSTWQTDITAWNWNQEN